MTGEYKGSRGSAQIWLESLVSMEMNNGAIIDWLVEQGMGYNRTSMRADINRTRLELLGAEQINRLDEDTRIPVKYMRERRIDTKYRYSVTVKFDYYDTSSLNTQEQGVTLYFNNAPSQNEVLEAFSEWQEARENGMIGSPPNVQEVLQINKVFYYRNRKP